ncbi:uncharacterized protein LOC126320392 isoform X2 [Schistocerca gregaria]|uniref:uncharacterized protein LOC126320392 isoform X2 n=1 Tax=Schistocerca gregaria TaxID=7010 RepID=UPI00211DABC3|nr:uncharacterized protein LOC126320392 isoform X2 [Schistocerca gregaria]
MEQTPYEIPFSPKTVQGGFVKGCSLELNSERPDSCQLPAFLDEQEDWSSASDKMVEYLAEYNNKLVSMTSTLNEKLDRLDYSVKSSLDRVQNIACRLEQLYFAPLTESNSISKIAKDAEHCITQNTIAGQDETPSAQEADHIAKDGLFSIDTEFTNKCLQAFDLPTSKDSPYSNSVHEGSASNFQRSFDYLDSLPPLLPIIDPDDYSGLNDTDITTNETNSKNLRRDSMIEQKPYTNSDIYTQTQRTMKPREGVADIDINLSSQETANLDENNIVQEGVSPSASVIEETPSDHDPAEEAIGSISQQSSKEFYKKRLSKVIQSKLQVYLNSKSCADYSAEKIDGDRTSGNLTSTETQPLSDSSSEMHFPFLSDKRSITDLLEKEQKNEGSPEPLTYSQLSKTKQNVNDKIYSRKANSNLTNLSSKSIDSSLLEDNDTKLSEFENYQKASKSAKEEMPKHEKTVFSGTDSPQFPDARDGSYDLNFGEYSDRMQSIDDLDDEDDTIFNRNEKLTNRIKAHDKPRKIFENSISPKYSGNNYLSSAESVSQNVVSEVSKSNIQSGDDENSAFGTNYMPQDTVGNRTISKAPKDNNLFDDDDDFFSDIGSTKFVNQESVIKKASPSIGLFDDDEDDVF